MNLRAGHPAGTLEACRIACLLDFYKLVFEVFSQWDVLHEETIWHKTHLLYTAIWCRQTLLEPSRRTCQLHARTHSKHPPQRNYHHFAARRPSESHEYEEKPGRHLDASRASSARGVESYYFYCLSHDVGVCFWKKQQRSIGCNNKNIQVVKETL